MHDRSHLSHCYRTDLELTVTSNVCAKKETVGGKLNLTKNLLNGRQLALPPGQYANRPFCDYPCVARVLPLPLVSLSLALALKLRRIARLVLQYLLFSVAVEEEDGDDTNTIDDSVPVVVHKGV